MLAIIDIPFVLGVKAIETGWRDIPNITERYGALIIDIIFPKYKKDIEYSRFRDLFDELSNNTTNKKKSNSTKRKEQISFDKILSGEDKRTSLLLKNIPHEMTKTTLSEILSGVGNINYLYLPYDKNTNLNEGFAILNIINYKNIINIYNRLNNLHLEEYNLPKPIEITYSKLQGKEKLSQLFWNKKKRKEIIS